MQEQYDYVNKYLVRQHLDGGAQGQVYMVTHQDKLYAAKVYKVSEDHNIQSYIQQGYQAQIRTLQRLKGGDNLISMVQYDRKARVKISNISTHQMIRPIIIMEFAGRGQLIQYVMKATRLSPETSKCIFRMILNAIKFMDSQGLTHRDIKPDNTLFNIQFEVKVGDFGHATVSKHLDQYIFHQETHDKPRKGTKIYRLPAIQNFQPYTGIQADIYSAGMTYFVMVTGLFPYGSLAPNDVHFKLIKKKNFNKYWELIKKQLPQNIHQSVLTNQFKGLIQSIFLSALNGKALTIDDLIKLVWLDKQKLKCQQYKREMTFIYEQLLVDNQKKRNVQAIRIRLLREQIERGQHLDAKNRGSCQFFNYLYQFLGLELSSIKLQQSQITSKTQFVKCKPSFLLAWIKQFLFMHFDTDSKKAFQKKAQKDQSGELSFRMKKINCFTGSLQPEITDFTIDQQEHTIKIKLKIQFETQNQPQTMDIQLDGKLVRQIKILSQLVKEEQIAIGIQWNQKSFDNFYGASLIKHIENQISMIKIE